MTSNIPLRTPYQGLLQILNYNLPFYLRAFAAVSAGIFVSPRLPAALRIVVLLAAGAAVFWTCSSLLIAHYVYDLSSFYSFRWLPACLARPPARWLNIHSGVDEASPLLAALFPGSAGQIIDAYDRREMSEPSIERARRLHKAPTGATGWQTLPAENETCDAAFLIFTAHELRRREARVQLLREAGRVLRRGGELVLAEHLRDWANFLAFGPGFLHFFSARTWQDAADAVGLSIRLHCTVTPFVHVFVLGRQP